MLTIGRLADAAGVNVETVRFYERRGLLEEPPRTASGYRQYSDDALWRLSFIGRAKALGFTLAEIKGLLAEGTSPEHVRAATTAKLLAVVERQRELDDVRRRLEALAAVCADGGEGCTTLTLTPTPPAPRAGGSDPERRSGA